MVREDLSVTQKDKFVLQAKVSELKSSMKTLLQQNQQLKLDLRRGAAKTVRGAGVSGRADAAVWTRTGTGRSARTTGQSVVPFPAERLLFTNSDTVSYWAS